MKHSGPRTLRQFIGQQPQSVAMLISHAQKLNRLNAILTPVLIARLKAPCSVLNFTNNQIIIKTTSAAWANRLRFEQDFILTTLHAHHEFRAINTVSIKVRPEEPSHFTDIRPMQKLSPISSTKIADLANDVRDVSLKNALLKLAQHRKKP